MLAPICTVFLPLIIHLLCTSSHPFSLLLKVITITIVLSFFYIIRFPHLLDYFHQCSTLLELILKTTATKLFLTYFPFTTTNFSPYLCGKTLWKLSLYFLPQFLLISSTISYAPTTQMKHLLSRYQLIPNC